MKRRKSAARRQSSATMRCAASPTRSSIARWSRSQLLLVLEFSSASRATVALAAPALSALALGAADASLPSPPPALQLRRNAPIASFGGALEEQRLARHRRDRRRLERLGDKKRRLGPLTGEEALGIGGDEDHRRFERCEQLVDRLKP